MLDDTTAIVYHVRYAMYYHAMHWWCQVLYADGMVGVHTGFWPLPSSRASSAQRVGSARSQQDRIETPTKKG